MTINAEGRQLRNEISKLRPDKRRRYNPALQERILDWVKRATEGGMWPSECGKALGIKAWRFTYWQQVRERRAAAAAAEETPLALVPIDTPSYASPVAGLTVTTPSGHRVDGLTLEQVVALLRELA
jgi:hypothetical protein